MNKPNGKQKPKPVNMGKVHLGRIKCMSKQGKAEVNIVLICMKRYQKIRSQNLE